MAYKAMEPIRDLGVEQGKLLFRPWAEMMSKMSAETAPSAPQVDDTNNIEIEEVD